MIFYYDFMMATMKLDSYAYRSLRNPLLRFLFDPLDHSFYSRLVKFVVFSIYCLAMIITSLVFELIYYLHQIGRKIHQTIDPFVTMPDANEPPSFANPCINKRNPLLVVGQVLVSTLGYAFISVSCAFFFCPFTSMHAVACMVMNTAGAPCVLLHHMLKACFYIFDAHSDVAYCMAGVKVAMALSEECDGQCMLTEPSFQEHTDAIAFMHEYAMPFAATHVFSILYSSNPHYQSDFFSEDRIKINSFRNGD